MKMSVYKNIRQWAKDRGIYEKSNPTLQFVKLQEETGELASALLRNDIVAIVDAIGDSVIVLTNLAAMLDLNIEECIDVAYDEIKNRKGKMDNGVFKKEL